LNFVCLHTREIFRILGLAERERKGPSWRSWLSRIQQLWTSNPK
jgi:hypothetical protein